jgi:hypothetical protein
MQIQCFCHPVPVSHHTRVAAVHTARERPAREIIEAR